MDCVYAEAPPERGSFFRLEKGICVAAGFIGITRARVSAQRASPRAYSRALKTQQNLECVKGKGSKTVV